jgi:transcriptional regulator with XRE-family HTH domain
MTTEPHSYANGTDLARAHTGVGPYSECTPFRSDLEHRGSVPDTERERLAAGFGAELALLRKNSAVSQARLGELAGLRGDHIGRLERGQRRPTVAAILAVSRILVAAGEREAVQQRLAALAGTSLREGAARKRQAKEHRARRKSLAAAENVARQARSRIRAKEMRGELVAGNLRAFADRSEQMVQRIRSEAASGPEEIPGYRPHTARPVSRRKEDMLAWAESYMRFNGVDGDGEDDVD